MRTKVTLDEDVAIGLRRRCADSGESVELLVNRMLRAGLRGPERSFEGSAVTYQTDPVSLGRLKVADPECIGELLSLAEGEDWR
jgi:plasmid stability protein